MISLSFSPAAVKARLQERVDLVVTNSGEEDVFSVRIVARFPAWLRMLEGQRRIEIPTLKAGSSINYPFVFVGDTSTTNDEAVRFPLVSYQDSNGVGAREAKVVRLVVSPQRRSAGRLAASVVRVDQPIVGQWCKVVLEIELLGGLRLQFVDLEMAGDLEMSGPPRASMMLGAKSTAIERSIRFHAAGAAVPFELTVSGLTSDGKLVKTTVTEEVGVAVSDEDASARQVYNIGKVEGNVGPGGTFNQANVGGVMGRASEERPISIDPELRSAIRELLSMQSVLAEGQTEERKVLEEYASGRAEAEDARNALRRMFDRTKAIRDGVIAGGLVKLIEFSAGA